MWPCTFDDSADCWWDYGPAAIPSSSDVVQRRLDTRGAGSGAVKLIGEGSSTPFMVSANAMSRVRGGPFQIGRAPNQPPNVPPPVYVDGKRITIHLNGTNATDAATDSQVDRRSPRPTPTTKDLNEYALLNATRVQLVMITPSACRGVTDVPPILPKLTYFCNYLPNICDNIRSHPDWPATNQMILTYDPYTPKGTRRRQVCPTATTQAYQALGKCDLRQHDPAYWKVIFLRAFSENRC